MCRVRSVFFAVVFLMEISHALEMRLKPRFKVQNFTEFPTFEMKGNIQVITDDSMMFPGLLPLKNPVFLASRNTYNAVTLPEDDEFRGITPADTYLFVQETAEKLRESLFDMYNARNWNRSARFFIYVADRSRIDEVLDVFAKILVYNVWIFDDSPLTITHTSSQPCKHLYTFVPNAENADVDRAVFKNCSISVSGSLFRPCVNLIETKPFAEIGPHSGFMFPMLRMLFDPYNWTILYRDWPTFCVSAVYNNIKLYDGTNNFSCVLPIWLNVYPYRGSKLQFFITNWMVIAIRGPDPVPEWQIIFLVFHPTVWLAHFSLSVVCVFIWIAGRPDTEWQSKFLYMFEINLGLAAVISETSLSTRCVLFGTLSYALFFINIFQARYVDLMGDPPLRPPIDTLEKLVTHNVTLYYPYVGQDMIVPALYRDRLTLIHAPNKPAADVFASDRAALLNYEASMREIMRDNAKAHGPRVIRLPGFFNRASGIFLLLKNHPIAGELNARVDRIVAAGFVGKFYNDENPSVEVRVRAVTYVAWKLRDLECAGLMGVCGVFFAAVVFLAEIFWRKCV